MSTIKPKSGTTSSLRAQEVQKKSIFKPLLTNPYTQRNVWPKINDHVMESLLHALQTDILIPFKQWNSLTKEERKLDANAQLKQLQNGALYGFNSIMKTLEAQVQTHIGNTVTPQTIKTNTNTNGNDNGNNDITTATDPVTVLFVCKQDITSKLLYAHIPTLCALSQVKLIQLPRGTAKKLTESLAVNKEITMLALRKSVIDHNKFVASMLDSSVEDLNIGFVKALQSEHAKLNMNVKFALTQMTIGKPKGEKVNKKAQAEAKKSKTAKVNGTE